MLNVLEGAPSIMPTASNIDFVIDFAARRIPGLKVIRPQASFLLWLDFRGLHLCHRRVAVASRISSGGVIL